MRLRIPGIALIAAGILASAGLYVPFADAQSQYRTARVTKWTSDCPAAKLQMLDGGGNPQSQQRLLDLVIGATQADGGYDLENADLVVLELDNGLSPTQAKPIQLVYTGQFIGISNGVADTRPTPLVVNTTAVGPFTGAESDAVIASFCRALGLGP